MESSMSIHLSKRLETICLMVTPGNRVLDVGTDHAHVPIRLLQDGICERALGFDVADGPLEIAKTNLELAGLTDRCEIRKSDGLTKYQKGEADTLIIAGMGGMLLRSLLERDIDKVLDFRELILSPHREPWQVREFLYQENIGIRRECQVEEDGKFYPVIRAVPGEQMVCPDWEQLSQRLQGTDLAGEAAANRERVLPLLQDQNFRRYAETTYGPALLADYFAGGADALDRYLMQTLAKDIGVYESLLQKEAQSSHAGNRMEELRGEIGMVQALVFLHHELVSKER